MTRVGLGAWKGDTGVWLWVWERLVRLFQKVVEKPAVEKPDYGRAYQPGAAPLKNPWGSIVEWHRRGTW